MTKLIFSLTALLVISSCSNNTKELEARIDALEKNAYRPGLGEFMTNIQIHHAKLWFAGDRKNWDLADFEIKEIEETLDDIRKFASDRKESHLAAMLSPAIDSIHTSIQQKSPDMFKASFNSLTNKCNTCHQIANFKFNVVKIPDAAPFSNQDFEARK